MSSSILLYCLIYVCVHVTFYGIINDNNNDDNNNNK